MLGYNSKLNGISIRVKSYFLKRCRKIQVGDNNFLSLYIIQITQLHQEYSFYIRDTRSGKNETSLRIRANSAHYPLSARSKAIEGLGCHRLTRKKHYPSPIPHLNPGDLRRPIKICLQAFRGLASPPKNKNRPLPNL